MYKLIQNIYNNNLYIELLSHNKQCEVLSEIKYKNWYSNIIEESKDDIDKFLKIINQKN